LVRATDGERTVVFITPAANFTLAPGESIHPQLKPAFQAEWTGRLSVLRAGKYTFHTAARVLIDGQDVQGKPVQLQAGERMLKIEFKRAAGTARLQVEWESDSFRREPVPPGVLSHVEAPAELAATQKSEHGRRLVEDLNCVACHTSGELLRGRVGPDLSAVGDRATATWIFAWLENPRHFRKDAAMPVLSAGAQDRADIAAYLAALKSKASLAAVASDATRAAKGKDLFASLGCAGCHDEQRHPLAGLGSKYSAAALAKYLINPLEVDPSGRMPDFALSHGEAEQLALHLVGSKNPDFEKAPPAGNAARGRELVASSGCANCHTIRDDRGAVASSLAAPAFDKLAAGKGCLAAAPSGKAARYDLSAADREGLEAFLRQPDRSPAPVADFHRLTTQLNCVACHELYSPARLSFPVNQSPPPLTDSGNKVRASWLSAVLLNHKRVRPWMAARMPHYGPAVAGLVNQFAAQAGAEPGEGAMIPSPSKPQVEAAVKLLGSGEGGLSCISCHDFSGQKSQGEMRGPDLTEMYARCRADWLRRWLWEPTRLQPGTAMPTFFSGMPAGKADAMIEQVLQALWPGKDMPEPPGWGDAGMNYTIVVSNEPVLLRTFLVNSAPRSIAVGLPGGQSYCFDAEFSMLRFAWSGGFLDMKPAWGNRGGEPAIPLGTIWFNTQSSYPLRIGNPEIMPKSVFRGYRFEKGVPVFLYEVNGVAVTEKITTSPDKRGIVREFELGPVVSDVWVTLPDLARVRASSAAGKFQGGRLKVPTDAARKFSISLEPQ